MKLLSREKKEWESGWWALAPSTAGQLVGGNIYFHKAQARPSFFGGNIIGYRIETEGLWAGRVVFRFLANPAFREVRASTSGWSMEKKIVL